MKFNCGRWGYCFTSFMLTLYDELYNWWLESGRVEFLYSEKGGLFRHFRCLTQFRTTTEHSVSLRSVNSACVVSWHCMSLLLIPISLSVNVNVNAVWDLTHEMKDICHTRICESKKKINQGILLVKLVSDRNIQNNKWVFAREFSCEQNI